MATDRVSLHRIAPEGETRAGRMLESGRLTATITSRKTRRHVTVRFRATFKADDGSWPTVPFREASHVFIEDFDAERVATFYPQSGALFYESGVSPAAKWSIESTLRYLSGVMPEFEKLAELDAADFCGRCGSPLTDPVSIERGFGPDCFGLATGSRAEPALA